LLLYLYPGFIFWSNKKCVSRILILYDWGFRFALLFGNFDLEILDAKFSQLTLIWLPSSVCQRRWFLCSFLFVSLFLFLHRPLSFLLSFWSLLLSVTLVSSVCWSTLLCSWLCSLHLCDFDTWPSWPFRVFCCVWKVVLF
jgi:hypothetical protein